MAQLACDTRDLSQSVLLKALPGLASFAAESRFPCAAAGGIAIALLCAFAAAAMLCVTDLDVEAMSRHFRKFSKSQRLLFCALGLLIVVVPWAIPSTSRGSALSQGFFEAVATQPLVLGLFTVSMYAGSGGILYFSFITIFMSYQE